MLQGVIWKTKDSKIPILSNHKHLGCYRGRAAMGRWGRQQWGGWNTPTNYCEEFWLLCCVSCNRLETISEMFLTCLRSIQQGHTPRKLREQGGPVLQTKPSGYEHLISCSRKLLHDIEAVGSHGYQSRMREGVTCRWQSQSSKKEKTWRNQKFHLNGAEQEHLSLLRSEVLSGESTTSMQSLLHTSDLVLRFTSDALLPPGLLLLCPNKTRNKSYKIPCTEG